MVQKSKVQEFRFLLFNNLEQHSSGWQAWQLTVAGINIRLLLNDPEKQVNLLPMSHLLRRALPTDERAFTVYIIDRNHAAGLLPLKCWSEEDVLSDSSIAGFAEHNIYTSLEADFGNFFLVDHDTGRAVKIFNLERDSLPDWEYCYPLRKIINQFTLGTAYTLIHGGGLAGTGSQHGMVLTGKGQSGKSTVCAVSVSEYVSFSGDDFLLVNTETATAYCLYSSLKIRSHLAGGLKDHAIFRKFEDGHDSEKSLYYIPDSRQQYLKKEFKIGVLVKPEYHPDVPESFFEPLSKSQMVRHLALSTLAVMRGGEKSDNECFSKISQLSRNLPCLLFRYNQDTDQLRSVITDYLGSM